jgi:hypothetical protein
VPFQLIRIERFGQQDIDSGIDLLSEIALSRREHYEIAMEIGSGADFSAKLRAVGSIGNDQMKSARQISLPRLRAALARGRFMSPLAQQFFQTPSRVVVIFGYKHIHNFLLAATVGRIRIIA